MFEKTFREKVDEDKPLFDHARNMLTVVAWTALVAVAVKFLIVQPEVDRWTIWLAGSVGGLFCLLLFIKVTVVSFYAGIRWASRTEFPFPLPFPLPFLLGIAVGIVIMTLLAIVMYGVFAAIPF